ncbi:transposase, partial [Sphingobacterium siyangense]
KQRCHDVEPVFGNIKQNHGFRRFMLRGKEKVSIEWGLLAIAQNLRKKAA